MANFVTFNAPVALHQDWDGFTLPSTKSDRAPVTGTCPACWPGLIPSPLLVPVAPARSAPSRRPRRAVGPADAGEELLRLEQVLLQELERREHLGDRRFQVLVPPVFADVIVVEAELVDGLTSPFFIRNPGEISRPGEMRQAMGKRACFGPT